MLSGIDVEIRERRALVTHLEKEIKELEEIKERFSMITKGSGKKHSSATEETTPKKRKRHTKEKGKRSGPTISQQIFNALDEGGDWVSGTLVKKMKQWRPTIKPASIYTTLNKLKKEGKLKQEGSLWHKVD